MNLALPATAESLKIRYGIAVWLQETKKEAVECPRCRYEMIEIHSCHLICPNCGSHLDCSDKGNFW